MQKLKFCNNLGIVRKCLVLILLAAGLLLYAQETPEESGYFPYKTDAGFSIKQVISFPAVPDVLRYEIEIESLGELGNAALQTLETTENRFEVSLSAGFYRYRITAYNKMELVEGRSGWQNFQIRPALQPEAKTFEPFYGLFYDMADTDRSITVNGEDFSAESEFALVRHKQNSDWFGKALEEEDGVILPEHVAAEDNRATLSFSRGILQTGNYDIFIRNPGGLWTLLGIIRVGHKVPVEWTFSFGYAPMFALFDTGKATKTYGGTGESPAEQINRLDTFNPLGYYIRFGVIPLKTRFGRFGIEAQFEFLIDDYNRRMWDDNGFGFISIFETMNYATFNILYQLPMAERWQHNVRLGVGMGANYHSSSGEGTKLYIDAGYSAQYFFWKNLYLEAGLDVVFSPEPNKSQYYFMLRPGLGMGWQLGRWADYAEVAEGARRGERYSVPVERNPRPEHLLSLGWTSLLPLTGMERRGWYQAADDEETAYRTNDEFIRPFESLGFNLHYAYIPYRWGKNNLGLDVELSVLFHKNWGKLEGAMRFYDLINEFLVGVRYQRVINERWQVNGKIALGMVNPYAYVFILDEEWERAAALGSFGVKLGASVQYFFHDNFFVEPSLDIVISGAPEDKDKGVSNDTRLYFKPGISVGYQFNRGNETGLRLPGTGLPSWRRNNDATAGGTEAAAATAETE